MPIKPEILQRHDIYASIERFKRNSKRVLEASRKLMSGRGYELETEERKLKAQTRKLTRSPDTAPVTHDELGTIVNEALVGPRNNILSSEFLEVGILTARAVCKISRGVLYGSGFHVGNGIVLTNHHVIGTSNQASKSLFEFLSEDNTIGTPKNAETFVADPGRFFFADKELDLCFVAILGGQDQEDSKSLDEFGWLPLLREEGKVLISDPVNIIQHPGGQTRKIVVHDSRMINIDNKSPDAAFCWYTGDTQKGSSGSPVLNANWEVVAVHHEAVPATDKNDHVLDINNKTISSARLNDPQTKIKWVANEGIRVSHIVARLASAKLPKKFRATRDELIKLWDDPLSLINARKAAEQGLRKN